MKLVGAVTLLLASELILAEPVLYKIDPNHTYPNFEADHNGGMSTFRGKFRSTTGTVRLDRDARAGDLDITVDTTTLDFGHDKLNAHAKGPDMFDVAKFPTAVYKGKFSKFKDDIPTEVEGTLTLHGVTKPLKLAINSFICRPDPRLKKEVCGADVAATFNRADFGIDFGQKMGFKQEVALAIQVEAIEAG